MPITRAGFCIGTSSRTSTPQLDLRAFATGFRVTLVDRDEGILQAESKGELLEVAEKLRAQIEARIPGVEVWLALGGWIEGSRLEAASRQEAKRAIALARLLRPQRRIVSMKEMLLVEVLASYPSGTTSLASLLDSLSKPPHSRARLRESLEAYIDSNLSLKEAARTLDIHPHTLAYRLKKTEEVLGLSLRNSAQRQVIEAALLTCRLRTDGRTT